MSQHRRAGAPPSGWARVAVVLVALVAAASLAAWAAARADAPARPVVAVVTPTATRPPLFEPLAGDPVAYQGRLYFFVAFHDAGRGPREHAVVTSVRGGPQRLVPGDQISAP